MKNSLAFKVGLIINSLSPRDGSDNRSTIISRRSRVYFLLCFIYSNVFEINLKKRKIEILLFQSYV